MTTQAELNDLIAKAAQLDSILTAFINQATIVRVEFINKLNPVLQELQQHLTQETLAKEAKAKEAKKSVQ